MNESKTSGRSDEPAPETSYLVREAVALFADEDMLESALLGLQEHGVDRSRLSVLGQLPARDKAGRSRNWIRHLVDLEHAPHGAPVDRGEVAEAKTAVIAIPGFGGVMSGLIAVMAGGGALGAAIGVAVLLGALGSGMGFVLSRTMDHRHKENVASQIEAGGLVLWVKLAADDEAVLKQLEEAGGKSVHVSERRYNWGALDVPFHDTQPDPFL